MQELVEGNNASHDPFLYKGVLGHGNCCVLVQGPKGTRLAHSRAAGASVRAAEEPGLLGPREAPLPAWASPARCSEDLRVPGSLQEGALCPSSLIFFFPDWEFFTSL